MQEELKNKINLEKDADEYLDCKDMKCPLPIVKLSKTIKQMATGQIVVVEATDPAFKSDVQAWVKTMDCDLLEFIEGHVQVAVIRKP
jgi:tRNA 2-thiouridine synthesizing protein A